MKKILTLQKGFFKKNIKDIISFSLILFISIMFFNSASVVKNNIDKAYEKKFNELKTSNVSFNISSVSYKEEIINYIKNIENVKQVEYKKGIMASIPINMDGAEQDQNIVFYNLKDTFNLNKYLVIESNDNVNNSIYLSYYIYTHTNLKLGDKFEYEINNNKYENTLDGVIEEMQYGNYSSSIIPQYLSDDAYKKLLNDNPYNEIVTISIETDDSETVYNKISKYLSEENIMIINKSYDAQAKNQKLAIANILVTIITFFSVLILLVSLLVSKFKISESIEEDIKNMGVLKALGYTSNEIIISIICPYLLSGIISSVIGIGLSLIIIPLISKIIEMQSGFIWNPNIDMVTNTISFLISITLILIFTISSAKVIKKLNPINAIREIKNTKISKNHFEVDKTKGNINIIIMLKNFINSKKQNILLGIVLLFITLIVSFVVTLYYNVNVNPINFINTLVEEHPDVMLNVNSDIKEEIRKLENVKNIIYYSDKEVINYKDNTYNAFIAENFNNLANDICYEGKNPSNSNEIALGSKIKEKYNLKINDLITIKKDDKIHEYKIVGFIQSVNYSGEVVELTLEGYKNLNETYQPDNLYIYLNDESKSSEFINHVKETYESNINSSLDYAESMKSALTMYVSIVSIISIVIIVITIILVYLILFILTTSIILKKKTEFGILKSLGYKNNQLISHIIGGFLPGVTISIILGIILSKIFMNSIYTFIFKNVGAYKVSFNYPVMLYITIGLIILFSTIILQIILSRKIKKISVYSLIKEW